jgi:secreted Zn-dependent insulinase-like peptidase
MEVDAVNSEYEIDVSDDSWKLFHLYSLLYSENHPASRFTIGNSETLKRAGGFTSLINIISSH